MIKVIKTSNLLIANAIIILICCHYIYSENSNNVLQFKDINAKINVELVENKPSSDYRLKIGVIATDCSTIYCDCYYWLFNQNKKLKIVGRLYAPNSFSYDCILDTSNFSEFDFGCPIYTQESLISYISRFKDSSFFEIDTKLLTPDAYYIMLDERGLSDQNSGGDFLMSELYEIKKDTLNFTAKFKNIANCNPKMLNTSSLTKLPSIFMGEILKQFKLINNGKSLIMIEENNQQ